MSEALPNSQLDGQIHLTAHIQMLPLWTTWTQMAPTTCKKSMAVTVLAFQLSLLKMTSSIRRTSDTEQPHWLFRTRSKVTGIACKHQHLIQQPQSHSYPPNTDSVLKSPYCYHGYTDSQSITQLINSML